ncbi:class I SAM-dependent methyltransferase [Hyphomonas sp. NPDC076900]|uniref:class I SAM-dependent methyltransferase n=1 Tax=unclassified Hyphomonas TaxID=2630699 RepID=UPI003CFCFED3
MDNTSQIEYWNGPAGRKWVRDADRMDVMLSPFVDVIISPVLPGPGQAVIDIGCGAGALSLNVAASAMNVSVTGVDVSAPLIELAKHRSAAVGAGIEFVVADAAVWRPAQPVDLVLSRFGVMFFADPVAAFANIRAGVKPKGRLRFACWRPLAENTWALAPLQAAMHLLKTPPAPPPPGTPGPFAFGDADHVGHILTESGWSNISITPWDGDLVLPGASAEDTAEFMLEMGPLWRAITEQGIDPDVVKGAVVTRLKELAGEDGRTRLKAAAWIVEAEA